MTDSLPAPAHRKRHFLLLVAGLAALSAEASAHAQIATSTALLERAVVKGQLLTPADFTIGAVSPAQARSALRLQDAIGMEAARNLAAGNIVRSSDVLRPQMVRRGEQVLIILQSRALLITSTGRALGSAAAGEPVRVVATATNRTLEAIAEAPGAVRVPF